MWQKRSANYIINQIACTNANWFTDLCMDVQYTYGKENLLFWQRWWYSWKQAQCKKTWHCLLNFSQQHLSLTVHDLPLLVVCWIHSLMQCLVYQVGGHLFSMLIYEVWQSSWTHRGKSATYFTAKYHWGLLQITPLGKLCTDASA
jgi:hypothetical protein